MNKDKIKNLTRIEAIEALYMDKLCIRHLSWPEGDYLDGCRGVGQEIRTNHTKNIFAKNWFDNEIGYEIYTPPKAKKTITLIGYINKLNGIFIEYKAEHEYEVPSSYVKVSERTIEMVNEN